MSAPYQTAPSIEIIERDGTQITQKTYIDNYGVKTVYEERPDCCCFIPIKVDVLVSTSTDPTFRKPLDKDTLNDLDVFLSTTDVIGDMQVIKNFGMVSATHTGTKSRQQSYGIPEMIANSAAGAESVRAHAFASLRARAKLIGANAVLGVKIDLESTDHGWHTISVAIATGTAVLLSKSPFDLKSSDFQYPPYMTYMRDDM
jgi:uncharacterized protein YbjQ (UPF0145 family)